MANFLVGLESVNQFIFPLISQTGITYRHQSLAKNGDTDFEVRAGDRMPYLLVDGKGVYDWLHDPKFHLLTFSNAIGTDGGTRDAVEREFGSLVDYRAFRMNDQVREIFGEDKQFHVLLRPDNYISFVSAETALPELRDYFDRFVRKI